MQLAEATIPGLIDLMLHKATELWLWPPSVFAAMDKDSTRQNSHSYVALCTISSIKPEW